MDLTLLEHYLDPIFLGMGWEVQRRQVELLKYFFTLSLVVYVLVVLVSVPILFRFCSVVVVSVTFCEPVPVVFLSSYETSES